MFKKTTCWIVLIYGLVLALLGYMGYHNAGSKISLFIGGGSGLLLVLSALLLFAKNQIGIYSSVFITLILAATFAFRYTINAKSVTAVLAVLSGAMLIFLFVQSLKWKTEQ
jgi:uncharacterized membrane protein (UPF0136 family)